MSDFETRLNDLLEQTKHIEKPIGQQISYGNSVTDIREHNQPSEVWMNDVEIFYNKYLKEHPLGDRIKTILFHRSSKAYTDLIACLESIKNDRDFVAKVGNDDQQNSQGGKKKLSEYDVFISHADKDKDDLVDDLNDSLERLGVKIFYDKNSLEWGDNWKKQILDGTKKSEFAIIVISENFFGREWTEKELNKFLNRQNEGGQKLILPILHHITISQLQEKYPSIAEIQAIDSEKYTCDQIALLFAQQLIKRLKNI